MSLLHRPTTLSGWRKGTIDPTLLKVIASIGMLESTSDADSGSTLRQARHCIQEVQDDILRHVGRQTITQLSILVVLLRFRFDVGDFAEAWNLVSIASRLIFTLRLNHEHESLDIHTRETVRRLVWTVYDIDRKCSGGIDYLTVCPVDMMYIRLPCDEGSFNMGIESKLPFLEDRTTNMCSGLSAHSCKLKLLATRDRILRYTKHIRKSYSDLSAALSGMESLQNELDIFKTDLPSEIEVSKQKLDLMVRLREGMRCIELHTMWLLSHCDLYRHCVPGIRESASYEALSQTPSTFIDHCQRACLDAAVKLCDLWSQLYSIRPSESLGDGMMAVAIYQVAQVLHHLPHLLTLGDHIGITDIPYRPSIKQLQGRLQEAIEMVTPRNTTRSYLWAKCVYDATKLVAALSDMKRRAANACPPTPSSVFSDVPEEEGSQHDHLQSRHHMLAYIARDSKLSESGNPKQVYGLSDHANAHMVGRPTSSDGRIPEPSVPASLPATNTVSNTTIPYMANNSFADYCLEDLPPWDPFDMVFNDYYDSNVDLFSASVSDRVEEPT